MFRLLRLIILGVIAFAIALWLTNRAEAGAGIDRISVSDPVTGKAAPTTIWYPSAAPEDAMEIGPYRFSAARGAVPEDTVTGLVVISHGSGGSSMGHVGTALMLARAGYVVAAPTHPGDNFQDVSDRGRWSHFAGRPKTISAMGLSRGGYTVLALVGAQPELTHLAAFCQAHPRDMFCLLGAAVPRAPMRAVRSQDWPMTGLPRLW